MENQAAKKRRDDDDVSSGSDRISQLPDTVLHHILCFLSHKKAAQTSVLSKSLRHLGPTRPVIDLRGSCRRTHTYKVACENCFFGNEEAFVPVLESTFQRYHHHNIFTQDIHVHIMLFDSGSDSVLEKWIPIMIARPNVCLNALHISFHSWTNFDLPSVVFRVETLRELYLEGCILESVNSIDNVVVLNNLQKLSFSRVNVADETLEKVISGCPLVKRVVISHCNGFKTFNISGIKNRYLNSFDWSSIYGVMTSIEIDAPTLQSIRIKGCSKWYHNHNNYFPSLKTLHLLQVNLPTESFENFSCNFPRLEELKLKECSGFEEINLSSRSINNLIIKQLMRPVKKVAIEVQSIRYFKFSSSCLLKTLSVTTTFREWNSHLYFPGCLHVYGDDDVLQRILKLFEMVKALSQSRISLRVYETSLFKMNQIEWDFNDHPVALEHLFLDTNRFSLDTLKHFLNALFRIFRPRYANAVCSCRKVDEEVAEFLWKTLIHDREKTEYGWEQHLEEVGIEVSDEKGKVWHRVEWTCLPEWSKNQKIRFRLKWRD